MANDLTYKGFTGSVEYNSEDRILFGKVLFVDSLLMYHGSSVQELEDAFKETVDAYLAHCAKNGKEPNRPYSGSFNVRTTPDLHRQAAQRAHRDKVSLNVVVCKALESFLDPKRIVNNNINIHLIGEKQEGFTSLASSITKPQWRTASATIQ